MSGTLVYLYCVTLPEGAVWAAQRSLEGLEGSHLRSVEASGLAAVVSDVPATSYDQVALDANVRDGEWLTPRATAHQAVNAAAHAALDAVLPVPFGTIYRTDERAKEMLAERSVELHAKLESVRGRAEWVVGLYRDTVQAAEHLSRVADAMAHREPVSAGPGRRYLEQRRADGARREELRHLDDEARTGAGHAVERVSRVSFEEPVIEDAGDLVARTTYLVRRSDEERLGHALEGFNADWRDRGYELRSTGPWPPYRTSGGNA